MVKRASFLMYTDQLAILEELSDEQAGKLFKAIHEFFLCDNEESSATMFLYLSDPLVKLAFVSLKTSFIRDNESYIRRVEANRENGKKGGRPRKARADEVLQKPKTQSVFQKPNKTQQKPKNLDNDNDNDIIKKNNITRLASFELFGENAYRSWKESILRKCRIEESEFKKRVDDFVEEAACRSWDIGAQYPQTRSLFYSWLNDKLSKERNNAKQQNHTGNGKNGLSARMPKQPGCGLIED